MDKKRTLRSYPRYEENPYKVNAGFKSFEGAKMDIMKMMSTEGEIFGSILVDPKKALVDQEKFCKVYEESAKVMPELSNVSLRVLMFIMMNVGKDKDEVYMDTDTILDYCGYSSNSKSLFFKAINELIEFGFIALSCKQSVYFINPNMFFNGQRTSLVKR